MIELIVIGITVAIIAIIIIAIGWYIGTYNLFEIATQDIKTQWSNITTEYQRRADLFYNLVETVQSYKNFEKETLIQVVNARNGNFGTTKAEQHKNLKNLDNIFGKFNLLFERYPKLKAGKEHLRLMKEIRITEDRINIARTDYNQIVGDYNKLVNTFPSKIIAKKHKFAIEQFFVNEAGTSASPKIRLA